MHTAGDPSRGPVKVLVVDDDRLVRWFVARRLKDRSILVTEAETAEQACELLAHQSFTLVVTDLVLPGANGLAVLAAARAAQPGAEVLLMTAHDEVLSHENARKLGAAGLILKRPDMGWVAEIVAAAAKFQPRKTGSASNQA